MIERLFALSDCQVGVGKHPLHADGAPEFQLIIISEDGSGTLTVQLALDRDALQTITDAGAELLRSSSIVLPKAPTLAIPRTRR